MVEQVKLSGITQHIGAYQIVENGEVPSCYTKTRGLYIYACAWCIYYVLPILVVAADDGLCPRTIEAINAQSGQRSNHRSHQQGDKPEC